MSTKQTRPPQLTLAIALIAFLLAFATAASANGVQPSLYALSNPWNDHGWPYPTYLFALDPADGSIIGAKQVELPGERICTTHGLAIHPTNRTIYAAVRLYGQCDTTGGETLLITIDYGSGIATTVGSLGDSFSSLAITDDGTLYGVTGQGANQQHTLYSIDSGTAIGTQRCTLLSENGHALAFGGGLLYHARATSSWPRDLILETIDPAGFPSDPYDPCPATGITFDQPLNNATPHALAVVPGVPSQLVMATDWTARLFALDLEGGSGTWEPRGSYIGHYLKGLVFSADAPTLGEIGIAKVAAKTRDKGGKWIDYTITVSNNGTVDATDVSIWEDMSPHIRYLGDNGGCVKSSWWDTLYRCDLGTIVAGGTKTITFNGVYECKGKCPKNIYNHVFFRSWGGLFDANLSNDYYTHVTDTKGAWK